MLRRIYYLFCLFMYLRVDSFPMKSLLIVKDSLMKIGGSFSTITRYLSSTSDCNNNNKGKAVLVLGGSGFVGSCFISQYLNQYNVNGEEDGAVKIIAISRRGYSAIKEINSKRNIIWVKGDATNKTFITNVFDEYGPFDTVVHSIGLLFDSDSGLVDYNKFASGSGSVPISSTYDLITRQTSFNAIDAAVVSAKKTNLYDDNGKLKLASFIFISAAEASWTFKCPVQFLERYLIAKRAVENKLLNDEEVTKYLRPVIFRPSLIWTWDRPQGLFSVIPFYVASMIGIPFVDRPTKLNDLVKAMVVSANSTSITGIKNYRAIQDIIQK